MNQFLENKQTLLHNGSIMEEFKIVLNNNRSRCVITIGQVKTGELTFCADPNLSHEHVVQFLEHCLKHLKEPANLLQRGTNMNLLDK